MAHGKLCCKTVGAVHIAAQAVKYGKSRRNVPALPYKGHFTAAVTVNTHHLTSQNTVQICSSFYGHLFTPPQPMCAAILLSPAHHQ